MRTEAEILGLILEFARNQDDIRAVVMNGSRVNPNAKKDPFQDYDIACYVTDVAPFRGDLRTLHFFGELMILQTPEDMGDPEPNDDGSYAYLMQFMDGNRIDLSFHSLECISHIPQDSLSLVLLDKDKRIAPLPTPSDRSYLPVKPSAKAFADCCNEFWWVTPYAAKGLWRDELIYAHTVIDTLMRGELIKMLTWYFGVQTGFQKPAGKFGKYLKAGLDNDLWQQLERTYADANPENTWQALFAMGSLFRRAAQRVAEAFGFTYPEQDDERVCAFIRRIRDLPPDARTIY
ncbi:MAG TPA: aminoglycoside adenylyltransferase [Anaerolineaceae bacterium]|nr:MAG: aminoglycoside adenylyltransferase [Chloroflexi bacterium GWB2_54_36]HAL15935.1 aminoglycoside adenylyltransferase [Anaerolineaceae bacterium]HBA90609.1 aminoglycoside adenylyltransferase [Anaerolineaceae bacterium]